MATILELPKLIDISLAGPDGTGIINFNLLHTILHVICRTIKIDSYQIEVNDPNKNLQESLKSLGGTSPINIEEYDATESAGKIEKGNLIEPKPKNIKKIMVVKRKCTEEYPKQPIPIISDDDFQKLSKRVDSIHDVVAQVLPGNETLIRSGPDSNAIGDMWNMLNITKRVDATEIGITKLTSMVSDLSREYNNIRGNLEIDAVRNRVDELERQSFLERVSLVNRESRASKFDKPNEPTKRTDPAVETISKIYDGLIGEISKIKLDIDDLKKGTHKRPPSLSLRKSTGSAGAHLGIPGGENLPAVEERKSILKGLGSKKTEQQIAALDKKVTSHEGRVTDFERNLLEMNQRIDDIFMGGDDPEGKSTPGIADIYGELVAMKNELLRFIESVTQLKSKNDVLLKLIGEINSRLAELNIAKADREEVDGLLAEKADYGIVQRKVSVDHFDLVNEDVANSIVQAKSIMQDHEENLIETNKLIAAVVETKLDKEELNPLKELLHQQIKILTDRLQELIDSQIAESAGTKIKLLKDIECIACNQNVIMRMEKLETVPMLTTVPPNQSMKPFHTYELDKVRQQLRMKPTERNMNSYQIIDEVGKIIEQKDRRGIHLSNRFCGGSHTKIGISESVQVKNLKKMKPADISDPNENVLKGIDGGLYKAEPIDANKDVNESGV